MQKRACHLDGAPREASVAVLGAFAGSALAADVQLYGLVDLGLNWTQVDNGKTTTDSFGMGSGQNSGSRFGLKGTEDLGNGYKVGFNLENSFKADDGAFDKGSRLFHRESILFVQTPYGELSAGRTGGLDSGVGRYGQMGSGATAMSTGWDNIAKTSKVFLGLGDRMDNTLTYQSPKFAGVTVLQGDLASGNGRYGLFGGKVSPFSTGWSQIAGHKYVMGAGFGRMDNSVTYKTPTFAGFNVLAQYSFKKDSTEDGREGSSDVNRQYALGASFTAGDLYLTGIVTQTNVESLGKQDVEDPLTVSLGGNYNFGVAKLYVAGQYFKDSDLAVTQIDRYTDKNKNGQTGAKFNGFGLTVGADVPAFGGTAKALVGYMDADDQAATDAHDMQRYAFSVGYEYPLSKRTFVYGGAGYYVDSYDKVAAGRDDKASVAAVNAGLVHKF